MRSNQQNAASAMTVIGQSIGAAAAITANIAPIPYMAPAVGIVLGILKLCDNVRSNK